MKKISLVLVLTFASLFSTNAQITITPGGTAASILAGFVGSGLTISGAVLNCPTAAYGTFSGGAASSIGLPTGIVLTTGSATMAGGANNSSSAGACNGTSSSDPQLTTLDPQATLDPCILEFDIVPQCNQLTIRFVFGSEEYPEFVSSGYNDAFGFFITGPNPLGGSYTNQNVAVIPGGIIASIDNINSSTNPSYYIDNTGSTTIQYDGLTTQITSNVNLTPCATYHFKLAIADAGDCYYDSGVFIDFLQCVNTPSLTMASTPASCGVSNGTASVTVVNGFPPFTYTWSPAVGGGAGTPNVTGLTAGVTYTVTVNDTYACIPPLTGTVTIGGSGGSPVSVNSPTICAGATATLTGTPITGGGTYSWAPGGATTATINVTPATTTTYTVSYTLGGCTTTAISTVTVNPLPVTTVNSPTICAGATATLTGAGATTYSWSTGATTNPINVTPGTTTSYTVTGTTAGCTSSAVATVTVNPLPITTVNSPTVCPGVTATLTAGGATTYSWSTGATTNPINVTPATTTSYTVTGTSLGCTSTAVATVTIGGSISPTVNSPTICAGATATLTATGGTTYSWSTGATTNPINVTPATTTSYTVTATSGGCTGTAVATVTVNPLPVTTVNSPTICAGATATLTGAGATTYSWSTGATTNPITVTPATTTSYTVTGTSLGCTSTAVSTVTVNPLPVTTVNSPTICPGGTATLTAAGATTYSWSTGATTNPINVTPATTTSYTVTGTTAGCTSSAVATVTIGSSITPTVNSPTICAGATATLTATGGTTYLWNTGSTANPLTVTPATTTSYTVTATAGGCTGTVVATVTVTPLPVTTVNSPTICDGATATLTAAGATTYSWSTGATTNPITDSPATTTSYTVTGTTAGCTSTAVATITVNPIPVTTVNSPSICPSSTANLIAGGATTYTWSAGATATGVNTADASPATTTTYTVTGTSLGCSSTAVATVTVNTTLLVNAGLNDSICFGESAVLGVTPNGAGYLYNWTPVASLTGATTATPTATPATTTTYSVTVTDPSGCTGTSTVTIFANPQITMAIAGIDVTCNGACNGQAIVIPAGGTPAYTYLWNSGCTSASCTSLCPASYTVTVTDAWGCTATGSATVIEPTLLTASVTGTTPATCNGICDGTATAAGSGGTVGGGYSYSWNTVPAQTTATATGLCAGTYTCTITDANSCTATITATITEPTLVVIAPIVSPSMCFGGTTNIVASASGGNGGPYNYTWTPPAGLDFTNIPNPNASPVATTVYTVNATDVNGCAAAPVNVTVTVNPPLAVVVSPAVSICPGASTPITATGSFGSGGPYTYSWSPATGLSDATISNPTASPATTTVYTVTVNDGCSPTVTATVTVTVLPTPVVTFSGDILSGCSPVCVTFTDASTAPGSTIASWNWTFGDGSTFSGQTPPPVCYTNSGTTDATFTVGLTVTSAAGCTSSDTYLNYIIVYANPIAEFTSTPNPATILEPTVSFTDQSTSTSPITTWDWNFGDGSANSSATNPVHDYSIEGSYLVTLTVTDQNGCIDDVSYPVIINPEFTFFIPNAFSPNGDGINDFFQGQGIGIIKYEILIFDRWGNLIWFTDDINKQWDGKANHGKEIAQEDVYVWKVRLTDVFDKKHTYIGTVTIVK